MAVSFIARRQQRPHHHRRFRCVQRHINNSDGRVGTSISASFNSPSHPNVCDGCRCYICVRLSFVAPNLISLRIEGAAVCEYPRRHLQDAVLEDIYLPYKCHFTLFEKSITRRLALRKIRISGEPPYLSHRFIDASKSSVTSLVLSDVRCSGPPPYHPNIYGTFFTMSLYPNLQELELSHLNEQCISGLTIMLRAQSPLFFVELRKLTLHNFRLTQDAATTITNSFTAVTEVVMDTLRGSQWFIQNLWVVGSRQLVWPLLEEIQLDGVMTRRLDQ